MVLGDGWMRGGATDMTATGEAVDILYGKTGMQIRLPQGAQATVIGKRPLAKLSDTKAAVRDALAQMVQAWHRAMQRAIVQAVEQGHLPPDTDAQQMLFEIHGLVLALHHDARFLRTSGAVDRARAGFERILGLGTATACPANTPATPATSDGRVTASHP